MRHYHVCTCIKSHAKKPLKYHPVEVDSDGVCVHCDHYAINVPTGKTIEEINTLLGLRYLDDDKEDNLTYAVNIGNAKPLRWTYGH